jgi:hypothetical protein
MQRLVPSFLLWLLYYSVASLVVIAPIGCGGGEATQTGSQVAVPAQETEAQNNMENFMKTQGSKKK